MYTVTHSDALTAIENDKGTECRECGSLADGQFCGPDCKITWNNRRRQRGAVLYDLFMAHRFERDASAKNNLWTLLCRQATDWRTEDLKERGGRRSWRRHEKVLAERPQLKAQLGKV